MGGARRARARGPSQARRRVPGTRDTQCCKHGICRPESGPMGPPAGLESWARHRPERCSDGVSGNSRSGLWRESKPMHRAAPRDRTLLAQWARSLPSPNVLERPARGGSAPRVEPRRLRNLGQIGPNRGQFGSNPLSPEKKTTAAVDSRQRAPASDGRGSTMVVANRSRFDNAA
jgi:hypothetical protein